MKNKGKVRWNHFLMSLNLDAHCIGFNDKSYNLPEDSAKILFLLFSMQPIFSSVPIKTKYVQNHLKSWTVTEFPTFMNIEYWILVFNHRAYFKYSLKIGDFCFELCTPIYRYNIFILDYNNEISYLCKLGRLCLML